MTPGRGVRSFKAGLVGAAALLASGIAVTAMAEGRNPLKIADAQYEPVLFSDIEGWADDDHDAALAAFRNSCRALLRRSAEALEGKPMHAALQQVCRKLADVNVSKPGAARAFFENNFTPMRISPLGTPDGFVTGYYEPIVEGTREQTSGYDWPLYRKPASLLPGGRMAIASVAAGKKKARKRKLVRFHERAAIDDGVLSGRNLEICWLKDPIDAFFIHIQGSVRVRLDDGKMLRLNYQAQNGHPYYAVGRYLIERRIVPKDEMSMDRIREWMERNPDEGKELRRRNKSYVFFREVGLAGDQEPPGAQGISLTPGRSIAVDRHLHVYGTPFFISAELPIQSDQPTTRFGRLMVAQDTGGAILGPARADIYFGAGDEAASIAGRLRHSGRFVMLVPHQLDPKALKGDIPLPRPKPAEEVSETKPVDVEKPIGRSAEIKPVQTKAVAGKSAKPEKQSEKQPEKQAEKDAENSKAAKRRKTKHKG
jgi:membrane-bound lytic murein transglycosylase A